MRTINSCIIFLLVNRIIADENQDDKIRPGHNQPLGRHRPPEKNMVILGSFPSPLKFHEEFVSNSRAVLFKGVSKGYPALKLWSDEYLRNNYGNIGVDVDQVKVEDRNRAHDALTMSEFLDIYNTSNAYMVTTLPERMRHDFYMPDCLLCGGFENRLQDFVMWFSSGGSKSHLHLDTVENINCMVSGSKIWFLVNKESTKEIIMDHTEGDYCSVDVDRVDMKKYPFLQNIPWWNVTVEQGDCIYVPYGWGHQVTSPPERNIAINIWWSPMTYFSKSSCNDSPNGRTLHDFNFTFAEQYRFQLKQLLNDNGSPLSFDVIHSNVVSEHTGEKLISLEDFNLLDKNKDNYVDANEIEEISSELLTETFDNIEPGTVNIKGHSIKTMEGSMGNTSKQQLIDKDEL